jgi:hypothetical protein
MAAKMNSGTKRLYSSARFLARGVAHKIFSSVFAQLRPQVPSANAERNAFAFIRTLFAKNIFSLRLISIDARAISR